MSVLETAFLFRCEGDDLLGVISAPQQAERSVGVIVVVGGPQYRVGSHRQFVLLARHLAGSGVPCMRFDYRGMGDSTGDQRAFEAVEADIRAAVDAFFERQPGLRRVALWALCDGASAACFYAPTDERIAGLVLLNPWVKTETGVARTYLKHYYWRRLTDPAFWKKLASGGVALGQSIGGLFGAIRAASQPRSAAAAVDASLPERMADSLAARPVPFVVFLSQRDYVAREFEGAVGRSQKWTRILSGASCLGTMRFHTDHTFSSADARGKVAEATLDSVLAFERQREETA